MRDFALETCFARWEFSARFHMTASDAESVTIHELLRLASRSLDELGDLHVGHTEAWGAPDLREAISETYDGMQPGNILCFAGAKEGGCIGYPRYTGRGNVEAFCEFSR